MYNASSAPSVCIIPISPGISSSIYYYNQSGYLGGYYDVGATVYPTFSLQRTGDLATTYIDKAEITNILDSIEVPRLSPVKLPNTPSPATDSDDNVPTDVILGCVAVLNIPTNAAPVFPIVPASMLVAVIPPLTNNPVKVPTDVILP